MQFFNARSERSVEKTFRNLVEKHTGDGVWLAKSFLAVCCCERKGKGNKRLGLRRLALYIVSRYIRRLIGLATRIRHQTASNLAYVTGVITDQLLDTLASINHCRESCIWKEVERADKHLAYIWEQFDQWNHKRESTTDGKNSQYALTCRRVILAPTKLYTNSQDVQFKIFVAKWSTSILIYFRANG